MGSARNIEVATSKMDEQRSTKSGSNVYEQRATSAGVEEKKQSYKNLTRSVSALNENLKTDFLKFHRIKPQYLKSRKEDEAI